jgi:DNA-binding SARP family transcriptional activator
VEEFLRASALDEARPLIERSLGAVVERLDYPVAERWLSAVQSDVSDARAELAIGELMLAIGQQQYWRGAAVGDRLAEVGALDEIVHGSGRAACMLAWCYFHAGRLADARGLAAKVAAGPDLQVLLYLLSLCFDDVAEPSGHVPPLTGGPLDALVARMHWAHGHFDVLQRAPASRWAAAAAHPLRVSALLAIGETERAAELAQAEADSGSLGWLSVMASVELLAEMGQLEQAWARFEAGRSLIEPTGSVVVEMLSALLEARLQLIGRDPERALDVLGRLREDARFGGYRFASELADTWRGLAHLMQGDASAAATALRQAVDSMRRGERILELPRAAVYLAEAEWRCGNEDAADAGARLAFETAQRQGTTHRLLQALVDTPAVAARAMDSEMSRDSGWHVLVRALITHDAPPAAPVEPEVLVREFGGIKLLRGDAELKPRIKKTGELVAYLLSRDRARASRHQLLEALFGGRDDRSTRAYLRQAIAQLRSVLPESVPLRVGPEEIAIRDTSVIASESRRIEALLSRSRRQEGERRLETLRLAVTIASAGDYLLGVESRWAEERRDFLAEIINDARLDLADLLYHHGHYSESCKSLEAAIKHDPYSERAWRLQMSLSAAVGDIDGVVEAFKHCRDRLAELALAPSAETLDLVERLRA